ncbi:unnamed protein product [Pleuronectes platessa]|uniref:Uncharacterized protein n=1 Tax=Pleuronectes platessa TaxID=8262 RepID=A0A9N7U762_PLEPL|nr:unnamed protein product [Pleuronectes platessa]
MIHLSVTVKSRRCPGERPKAVKFCLCEASYHKSPSFRCVWTRMTHGLRNTGGSTMCKCEENMAGDVPLSHSCPLGVSIETETGSTVGAGSMTGDREDPHTK